jgi:hypothetical protein
MADSTTPITQITTQQGQKEVTLNGLIEAASWALMYGRRQETSFGLTWGFNGGRLAGVVVAPGSVTLTANATNYVTASRSTGAVSVSTLGYNWTNPAAHARLYRVVTDANGPTSYQDHRFGGFGCFPSPVGDGEAVQITLPLGDGATAVTTGAGKAARRAVGQMIITDIRASVATASSSGVPAFDVNVGGLSALGTALTIDANEKTSTTAAAPFTFAEQGDVVADDDEITIDVDTAGTSTAGLAITLIGIRSRSSRYRDVRSLLLQGQGANAGTVFTDSSPVGRTITRIDGPTTSTAVADPWGGGLSSMLFDGTNDGLSAAYTTDLDMSLAGDFTLRGFGRLATSSGLRVLLDFRGTAAFNSSWVLYADAANRHLAIYNGPTTSTILAGANNSLPASGNWFSWQVSKRGTTTYVFSDGVLRNSATYSPPATQASGMRIGIAHDGSQGWHGYMRDVEILYGVGLQTAAYTPARRAAPAY